MLSPHMQKSLDQCLKKLAAADDLLNQRQKVEALRNAVRRAREEQQKKQELLSTA